MLTFRACYYLPVKLLSKKKKKRLTKKPSGRKHVQKKRNVVYIVPRPVVGVSSKKKHIV